MLRPNPAMHYISTMLSRGNSLDSILENTGIHFQSLSDPSYLITVSSYKQLLQNIIALDDSDSIGFYIGSHNHYGDYGVLAYAGISSRNIREGLENTWCRFGASFGVMARPTINDSFIVPEQVCIEFSVPWLEESLYRFSIEEAMCILSYFGSYIVGTPPAIHRIELSYPAPAYAQKYRDTFNCPVHFGAVCTRFIVDQSWVSAPLLTTDPEVNSLCIERLNRVLSLSEVSSEIEQHIRNMLVGQLHEPPHIDEVAASFNISSRTLTRQLKERGTNYRTIVEDLRRDMAINWLNTTQLQAKEISYRLGYKDTGTFRRAFKAWTGQTINEYRQQPH